MKFKVGDVVIGVGLVYSTQFNGMEGVVTRAGAPFKSRNIVTMEEVWAEYEVQWSDGAKHGAFERNLKPRRPPEERGSWVDVYAITGWMPLEHARTKVCQKN